MTTDHIGDVYVTGQAFVSPGDDFLTVKYDPLGSILWLDTPGLGDFAFGIAVDVNRNTYVTGRTFIGGNFDIVTIKYDSLGNIVWGDTLDNGSTEYAWDVAVDASENIYITGHSFIGPDEDYFTVKYARVSGVLDQEAVDGKSPNNIALDMSTINKGIVSFSYVTPEIGKYRISLFSVDGKATKKIEGNRKGYHTGEFSNLPSGVYFLVFKQRSRVISRKVILVN